MEISGRGEETVAKTGDAGPSGPCRAYCLVIWSVILKVHIGVFVGWTELSQHRVRGLREGRLQGSRGDLVGPVTSKVTVWTEGHGQVSERLNHQGLVGSGKR